MRILIFNTFYYPKFVGGAEISVQLLAEGLVKANHKVYVVTFGSEQIVERINGVVIFRIKQLNIYSSYNDNHHSVLSKSLWHLADSINPFYHTRITNILKKVKPDIVHTNNIQGFSPGLWAIIKSQNLPLIHTIRDYYLLCHQCNMFRNNSSCSVPCADCRITSSLKLSFIKFPDLFIGISEYIIKEHSSIINKTQRKVIVYNGVDISNTLPVKQDTGKLVFGFMGRISKDKGIEYLINEFANITDDNKLNIKIIIAGKGDEAYVNHLKSLDKNLDLEFIGVVKPDFFYSKIDVLIVPSLWPEPFGRTVVEALSFKVPVCIAESGGLTELHNESCTWLFKPETGNLKALIELIVTDEKCIQNKKSYCLEHASQFSSDNYVTNYLNIYEDFFLNDRSKQLNPVNENII